MTMISRTVGTRRSGPVFDFILVLATVVVAGIGLVMVYSATRGTLLAAGDDPHFYLKKQALFVLLGFFIMVVFALFDYRRLEPVAMLLYVLSVLSLLGVMALGSHVQGSQRWFSIGVIQIQPSEFAVIGLIVAVAAYCDRRSEDGLAWKDVLKLSILSGIPIGLVLIQPDLGTAIIMMIVLLVMLAVAGLPVRILVLLVLGVAFVALVAVESGVLHAYQIARLTTFLNPNSTSTNPQVMSAIYNTTEAKNAIGAGGLLGTGLLHGAQTNLGYVPEQSTDFIFTAVGEQLGFVGAVGLLSLLGVIAWRVLRGGGPIARCLRPSGVHGALHVLGLQRVPERRHDDGHHAHHRYSTAVRQLRGYRGHLLLLGCRSGPQCRRPPENAVTDMQSGSDADTDDTVARLPPAFRVMDVEDVSLDLPSQFPLVTLVESEPPMRTLVFPVGLTEGTALALAMRRMDSLRPMTHELFVLVLQRVRIDVIAVRLVGREQGNYLAELDVMAPNGRERIGCRPSDGLVLALRMPVAAPILVDERLLEESGDVIPQPS